MKGTVKRILFIILFLTSLFVLPRNTNAKGTDARIDGQYPMGVSSDYMFVAGNRLRIPGDGVVSGRLMANSMAFKSAEFNDSSIWSNSLNKITENGNNDFYANLWNPAVVINDFTREEDVKEFNSPTKKLVTNIAGMWPYAGGNPYTIYPADKKRIRFITDTSKDDIKKVVDDNTKKLVDTIWKNNLDTETEDNQPINGLSDLSQFKDNNVTKYLSRKNVAGRSVENDIEDVSDYYDSLAPGNDDTSSFYASDSRIIDDNKNNPQYTAKPYTSEGTVVINIKSNSDAVGSKGKPIVAATIDKQRLIEAVKTAGNSNNNLSSVHILFNFSKDFYTNDKLDPKKIPYIVLNYKGFSKNGNHSNFKWDTGDMFGTGEIKDGEVVNEKPMYEALGVKQGNWQQDSVLWMGSQILNNFTDVYDTDRGTSDVGDNTGNGSSAAVYFLASNNIMYGSFIVPHGSFYATSGSHGSFIGGVSAANNITIDNSAISPDQNNGAFGVFGRKENGGESDFPNLNNPGDQIPDIKSSISKVDLTNGSTQTINESNQTVTFDYKNGSLHELPKSGISSKVHIKNAPEKFGLYYKLGDEKVWYRIGDGEHDIDTNDDTAVSINDLESILVKNNKSFNRGQLGDTLAQSDKTHMGYSISRNNKIEFAVSDTYDKENITDDNFKSIAEFSFNLKVDGTLEVDVPSRLNMGTELLGKNEEFIQKININEVQVAYKKVSAKFGGDGSNLVVYNPMKYPFKLTLNRIVKDDANPFGMTKNFGYQITTDGNPAAYLPMINGTNSRIDIISRIDDDNNVGPVDPNDPNSPVKFVKAEELLQSKTMYFKMPYSADYEVGTYTTELTWSLN